MVDMKWPYPDEFGQEETVESDVLVLGGGMAGCFAAIAAARRGQRVVLVEKGATKRSGSAGTGFDHWESACTNPCSKVTPKEIAEAYVDEQDHFSNGIAHYIECREGYDRVLDLEGFGGKVRDTDDDFKGAEFRDEKTKLMFAYDYENKFTLRVWGSTFKPALYNEMKRLGVKIYDRTEATALLTAVKDGKKRGAGAIGMNVHTGKILVFKAKSTVLTIYDHTDQIDCNNRHGTKGYISGCRNNCNKCCKTDQHDPYIRSTDDQTCCRCYTFSAFEFQIEWIIMSEDCSHSGIHGK